MRIYVPYGLLRHLPTRDGLLASVVGELMTERESRRTSEASPSVDCGAAPQRLATTPAALSVPTPVNDVLMWRALPVRTVDVDGTEWHIQRNWWEWPLDVFLWALFRSRLLDGLEWLLGKRGVHP